jgi:hypothetical protein
MLVVEIGRDFVDRSVCMRKYMGAMENSWRKRERKLLWRVIN